MKKFTILTMILLLLLTACGRVQKTVVNTPTSNNSNQHKIEDCDKEDLLEGDEDCYGIDLKKNKHGKKSAFSKSKSKSINIRKNKSKPKSFIKSKSSFSKSKFRNSSSRKRR
jgi:hypothetical protein